MRATVSPLSLQPECWAVPDPVLPSDTECSDWPRVTQPGRTEWGLLSPAPSFPPLSRTLLRWHTSRYAVDGAQSDGGGSHLSAGLCWSVEGPRASLWARDEAPGGWPTGGHVARGLMGLGALGVGGCPVGWQACTGRACTRWSRSWRSQPLPLKHSAYYLWKQYLGAIAEVRDGG